MCNCIHTNYEFEGVGMGWCVCVCVLGRVGGGGGLLFFFDKHFQVTQLLMTYNKQCLFVFTERGDLIQRLQTIMEDNESAIVAARADRSVFIY